MATTEVDQDNERTLRADPVQRVEAHVSDRVLKPVHEVFAAIVDPARLARFFISSASGPLKAGSTVEWIFADVGGRLMVDVDEIENDKRIVFDWTASGTKTTVTIGFKSGGPNATIVTITEEGWPMDRDGVTRALGQTAGWTDFICCMKADLQYGVNLRLGRTKETESIR